MNEPALAYRWREMKKRHTAGVENVLRDNEHWCMNACSRYLKRETAASKDCRVWFLDNNAGLPSALIVHSKKSLLPVLCGQKKIPALHFLCGFFSSAFSAASVHSIQGRTEDIIVMEKALEKIGLRAAEKNNYDLMYIDRQPLQHHSAAPAGLVIRKPLPADMEQLAALHAAYEQEEVLPAASVFHAAVSRMIIERIFAQEQMLVAELGGRLVGKINTNAVTFTRYQIGGVYVHPSCRGLGIARKMAAELSADLISQGKGISLFVRKTNPAARRVYQRVGFEILGDYRINYY